MILRSIVLTAVLAAIVFFGSFITNLYSLPKSITGSSSIAWGSDLLRRPFEATHPEEIWMGDVTLLDYLGPPGWLYLA